MKEVIKFSVVIPVRNGANYIAEALESVLKQTYPHFNILILENCSQDNTLDIIRSFSDPRIQIFPADAPLSIEDNWGRILDLEMNEYLVLLCHDDVLYPEFLQEIVDLIEAESQATLYHANFHWVDKAGKVLRAGSPVAYRESADEFLHKVHQYKEDVFGSGYVMRSADFKRVGGYPKFVKLLFADLLCYYWLTLTSYKVCSPKYLYAFRDHTESAGHQSHALEFCEAGEKYLNALKETTHFQSSDSRALAYWFIKVFVGQRYRWFLHNQLIKARNPRPMVQFHTVRQCFTEAAVRDPLFAIRSPAMQLYEWVAQIPWWLPRLMVFRLINVGALVRQKLSSAPTPPSLHLKGES